MHAGKPFLIQLLFFWRPFGQSHAYGDITAGFNELIEAYAAELILQHLYKLPHQPLCRKICRPSISVLSFPDFINVMTVCTQLFVWFVKQEYALEKDTSF